MSECGSSSIYLTLKVIAISATLHLIFGIFLGYYLSQKRGILRDSLEVLVTFPLIFPPIAIGFFLLLIFGKDGVFGNFLRNFFDIELIFSFNGIVLASFIAGLPLIVKPIQSAIESSSKNLVEASYTLGKSKIETVLRVILPNIKRAIFAGLTLAIGRSLGEVGITLMLGGNIIGKTDTISLAIYNAVLDGEFDCAIILSTLLGSIAIVFFFILRRLESI